jgi:hypothetical protein
LGPGATDADIEHLALERGHRTLTITRKDGKVVTIPLAPRTARAIDLAIGERTEGPVFLALRREATCAPAKARPREHELRGALSYPDPPVGRLRRHIAPLPDEHEQRTGTAAMCCWVVWIPVARSGAYLDNRRTVACGDQAGLRGSDDRFPAAWHSRDRGG